MRIISRIDGSALVEIRLEGELELSPLEIRDFLDALATSGMADNAVMRVGESEHWVKLASRWGSAARFIVAEQEEKTQHTLRLGYSQTKGQ